MIQYYVFNIIDLEGTSLKHLPLIERKQIFRKLLPEPNIIRYCDHFEDEGKIFFRELQKMGLEGNNCQKEEVAST